MIVAFRRRSPLPDVVELMDMRDLHTDDVEPLDMTHVITNAELLAIISMHTPDLRTTIDVEISDTIDTESLNMPNTELQTTADVEMSGAE